MIATSPVFPQTIGDVARTFRVTPSLIRHYELIGVVKPARDSIGRRLYLPGDVERIAEYRNKLRRK
jgi:DNA-binding transcriptional MerR regulator